MFKETFSISKLFLLSLMLLFILACSFGAAADPTPTAVPTATETEKPPEPTETIEPTETPLPTETAAPPTPAAVGETALGEGFDLTVVDAYERDRIYPGGQYSFTPKAGYMIVDIGMRVQNQSPGTTLSFPWNTVYILEDNGDGWYPLWGSVEYVGSGETMDSMTIGISEYEVDGEELIKMENDAYLRMIFIVKDTNENLLVGIGDSQQVALTLKK